MSPLSILSVQITPLITGFELTCVLRLQPHSNGTMPSRHSAQRAVLASQSRPSTLSAVPTGQLRRAWHASTRQQQRTSFNVEAEFLYLSLSELTNEFTAKPQSLGGPAGTGERYITSINGAGGWGCGGGMYR